ncbi:MAG: hypothetical protein HY762_05260 [Planctomycetes bacterium]|nr:hypothetical protein [Planctomycetota bacterium]
MILYFISIIGLFLLIAMIISLGLGLALPTDDIKIITRVALKNLRLLCIMVLVICLIIIII